MKSYGNLSRSAARCKLALAVTLFLAVLILPAAAPLATETPVSHLQSETVRRQTVKAMQLLSQDQWTLGRDLIAQTKDPLASKLYYWMLFTREKERGYEYVHLAQFIRRNPEWPGIKGMRKMAEKNMSSALTAAEISGWFADYPPQTARGMDRYLQALYSQGKKAEAKAILADWWATTPLGREDQKDIYRKYALFIDATAHKRRLDMLLFESQYTNARAIAAVLGPGYAELVEARIALAEEKPGVNALLAKVPRQLHDDPGLLFERLRWRRRNNMDVEAMEILHQTPAADKIANPEAWWQERHIIIRRLLERKSYESAYLLASKHRQSEGLSYAQAEWMAGWLSLRFLNNAPRALQHFEALYHKVDTPVSKARAAYWAGRAGKAMKAPAVADKWYKDAARFQTVFYGQLAGAELGIEEALPNAAPPVISAPETAAFNAREMIQAARIFHEAGMRNDASRFIQAFAQAEKTPKAYRFSAETAAALGHYHDAVKISKEATKEGMFLTAQSYPVITDQLRNISTEWALVHALIRQESMFDHAAQSPAGALGLMQLMPATAKEVAGKLGVVHSTSMLLQKPDYNIRLGSAYFNEVLERFNGSYPLAIAAYNAGPGRVDKWLATYGDPRRPGTDLIDWIEMIPIYETRNYVQRVMEGVYVYRLRLRGVQKPPLQPIHIALENH